MTLVTIIVTCFNDGRFLPEAVASAEQQSHPEVEIIVTDDGSTDPATVAVIDELDGAGTHVLRNPHGGLSANRNAALALARGEYLVCLDADDRLHADYVSAAAAILHRRPEVCLVAPDMQWFGDSDTLERTHFDIGRQLIGNRIPAAAMYRAADMRAIGGYHEALPHHEDFDLWLGLLHRGGEVAHLGSIGLYRRAHRGQMSAALGQHINPPVLAEIARRHGGLYAAHAEDAWRALLAEREMLAHFKARYGRIENLLHGVADRVRGVRRR